tara:strand:+ start:1419 stop:1574 length:156 start_codon:yes stop_codon:yes gene_type:complete
MNYPSINQKNSKTKSILHLDPSKKYRFSDLLFFGVNFIKKRKTEEFGVSKK